MIDEELNAEKYQFLYQFSLLKNFLKQDNLSQSQQPISL